jgi:hypothetical protein
LGGGGAGGNGGPSYGIVYAGGRPSQSGGTTIARGSGGPKGRGGGVGGGPVLDGGLEDGGLEGGGVDSGPMDVGGSLPEGGVAPPAPDGLPGEEAYEIAIP